MVDKVICNKSDLVNIADAVRSKLGVTNTYYVSELSSTIQNIQTGGITPSGTISITENGTVDVSQYANAEVNVSSSPSLQSKSVTYTENGTVTITPDEGYDGLSSVDVTVDVAGSGGVETCTVTFSSNVPDGYANYIHDKILLTVFENNEITTKTIIKVNNTIVSNVVINSIGMVLYNTLPQSISTTNATKVKTTSSLCYGFTFTGNASITSTFEVGPGGGPGGGGGA